MITFWLLTSALAGGDGMEVVPPPPIVAIASKSALQAEIEATPAFGVLSVPPGQHAGPLLLSKPIHLVGAPGSVIEGNGRGTVITVAADDVELEGLTIRGGGHDTHAGDSGVRVTGRRATLHNLDISDVLIGIDFSQAHDSSITDTQITGPTQGAMGMRGDGIRLWESTGNTVIGNSLSRVRDVVIWYSSNNHFEDNVVTQGRYGLHFMHSDHNRVLRNRLEENVVGVFIMYSLDIRLDQNRIEGARGAAGMGIGCKESDAVDMANNRIVDNNTGIYIDACPHRIDGESNITNNLFGYNHVGLRFHQVKAGINVSENDFYENGSAVVVDGGGNASLGRFSYNRWSEYAGYDLNTDGIGDLPYAPSGVSRGLVQRRPVATFFAGTPAAWLLDFLGTAFPMFAPKPLFSDSQPRMGRP